MSFLRKKITGITHTIPLNRWKGQRVAIDIAGFYVSRAHVAHGKSVRNTDVLSEDIDSRQTLDGIIDFLYGTICKFMTAGITPVFVFEGTAPEAKKATQLARRETIGNKWEKLREYKEYIASKDILEVTIEEEQQLRKLLSVCPENENHMEILRIILQAIGIPCIQAYREAEELCCVLCQLGMVGGVYSNDSDCAPRGCPVMIREITGTRASTVFIDDILNGLSIEFDTFIDMCIMAKCDYNNNIPNLGVKRAYDLLVKHGRIEDLPDKYQEKVEEYLNVDVCREIFSIKTYNETCVDTKAKLDINIESLLNSMEVLEEYGIDTWMDVLYDLYKNLPKPTNIEDSVSTAPLGDVCDEYEEFDESEAISENEEGEAISEGEEFDEAEEAEAISEDSNKTAEDEFEVID